MPNAKGDLVSGGKPITETRPFILVRSRPRLSCPSTAPWTPSPYPDRYCSREPPCRWRWWPTSVSGDRSSKGGGMVVERGAFVQAIFGVGGSLRNPGAVATGSDSAPTTRPLSARGKWGPPSGVVRRRSETCGALVIRSRVPSSGPEEIGLSVIVMARRPLPRAGGLDFRATRPARGSGGPRSSCQMALGPESTHGPPLGSDLLAKGRPWPYRGSYRPHQGRSTGDSPSIL